MKLCENASQPQSEPSTCVSSKTDESVLKILVCVYYYVALLHPCLQFTCLKMGLM